MALRALRWGVGVRASGFWLARPPGAVQAGVSSCRLAPGALGPCAHWHGASRGARVTRGDLLTWFILASGQGGSWNAEWNPKAHPGSEVTPSIHVKLCTPSVACGRLDVLIV